jgi:hypothetical protein
MRSFKSVSVVDRSLERLSAWLWIQPAGVAAAQRQKRDSLALLS